MTALGSRADFGVILNQDLPEQEIPELLRQSTFLSAKENTAFVRLFEDKEILMDFLNAVLRRNDEDAITEVEHMNRDLAVIYPSDDIVGVDVHAKTKKGEYIDVEMQRYGHTHFKDRVVLYGAVMAAEAHREELLSLQKRRRELSLAERYRMPKIYSIWICENATDGNKDYRDTWAIYRKSDLGNKDALPVSDVLNYIFIKLPKLEAAKDVPEREREWMDFINNCGSRDEIPSTAQGAIRDAYERLRIRRTPKEVLERQAFSMTTQYDIDCCIDDAINEGLAKGFEKGLAEGHAEGRAEGRAEGKDEARTEAVIKALKRGKLTLDEIAEDNDVSIDRVLEIQKNLFQQ
ncbi:MAG: PD-(D/E)XK nuclease family transposase [Fibrobacter sp.]|nr:PD-(D/E)XK nuclease family transposase [Fibrobacter sp.]